MTSGTERRNKAGNPGRTTAGKSRRTSKQKSSKAEQVPAQFPRLGPRLRHARTLLGLSLREVADQVGISESFVSKIENDHVRPSLATLHKIVTVLQTNIGFLFADVENESEKVMLNRQGRRPVIRVLGKSRRSGIMLERLIPALPENLLQANIHVVPPGEGTDELISHSGQEFGFILEGNLDLTVAGETYSLSQGDAFVFESVHPHGYRNNSGKIARVIWVNTPPTF